MGYLSETDAQRLTAFYAALIRDCEHRIDQNRSAFMAEVARIKASDAQAAYKGNFTDDDCWKAFASDDFIQIVSDLSKICGVEIGAVKI